MDERECQGVAKYRIDVVKSGGPDHAFCCEEHLPDLLVPILEVVKGKAARVSILPLTSEEPCEIDVE